jgi:hypothetical protein
VATLSTDTLLQAFPVESLLKVIDSHQYRCALYDNKFIYVDDGQIPDWVIEAVKESAKDVIELMENDFLRSWR